MGASRVTTGKFGFAVLLAFLFSFGWAGFVSAEVTPDYTVDTLNDTVDANLEDTACLDANGDCSLRAAIMQANATPGMQVIQLQAGTHVTSIINSVENMNENASATGDYDITSDLHIFGPETGTAYVDGDLQTRIDRVFHVHAGATVTMTGFVVQGGVASGNSYGGGILNAGDLTLQDMTLTGNEGYGGAAVANVDGGTLTLLDTVISDNESIGSMGAVLQTGTGDPTVTASGATIEQNVGGGAYIMGGFAAFTESSFSQNVSGSGGGLTVFSSMVELNQTTVEDNTAAEFGGGGIVNYGILAMQDTTIRGNSAAQDGGGIFNGVNGSITMETSVVTENVAGTNGGGLFVENHGKDISLYASEFSANHAEGSGGGIYVAGQSGNYFALKADSTKFEGNTATGSGSNVYNAATTKVLSLEYNWWGSALGPGTSVYGSALTIPWYTEVELLSLAGPDHLLQTLHATGGTLEPDFTSEVYEYTLPTDEEMITLRPISFSGTIDVNGEAVISGTEIGIPVEVGKNEIVVTVTGTEGTQTYTIVVTRMPAGFANADIVLPSRYWGFYYLNKMTVDDEGYVYIADNGNDRVVKTTSNGDIVDVFHEFINTEVITTAIVDEPFLDALSAPSAVALDGFGNLYIADGDNGRIVVLEPDGDFIRTIGSWTLGDPNDVGLDSEGNVYVADWLHNAFYKFDPSGELLWSWNNDGLVDVATSVAVDAQDNVYVAYYEEAGWEGSTGYVYRLDGADSSVIQSFQTQTGNMEEWEMYARPYDLEIDADGALYVLDEGLSNIQIYTYDNEEYVLAETWEDFTDVPTAFALSRDFSLFGGEPRVGVAYVSDYNLDGVVKLDPVGTVVDTWASDGEANGLFSFPVDVDVDASGDYYVADSWNYRLQKFDASGDWLMTIASEEEMYFEPVGVVADVYDNIYAIDVSGYRALKFGPTGELLLSYDFEGFEPTGIDIGPDGLLYVSLHGYNYLTSMYEGKIVVLDTELRLEREWSTPMPVGVAVDGSHRVYAPSMSYETMKVYDGSGSLYDEWEIPDRYVQELTGIEVHPDGHVLLADGWGQRIHVFTEEGTYLGYYRDFLQESYESYAPYGMKLAPSGDLYVADASNDRILRLDFPNMDARLSDLSTNVGTLTPAFDPMTAEYTVIVPSDTTSLTVTASVYDETASLTVDGTIVGSGTGVVIPIAMDTTVVPIIVAAENGAIGTYTLTIERALSANADLASLTPSAGELVPAFDPDTHSYAIAVDSTTESIAFTPVAADAGALIFVNELQHVSGALTDAFALAENDTTTIAFTVVAPAQNAKTYTVVVDRLDGANELSDIATSHGSIEPTESPGAHDLLLSETTETATLTAVIPETATAVVAGANYTLNGTALSVDIAPETEFAAVTVIAEDASVKTYIYNVVRLSTEPQLNWLLVNGLDITDEIQNDSQFTYTYTTGPEEESVSIDVQPLDIDYGQVEVVGAVGAGSTYEVGTAEPGVYTVEIVATSADGLNERLYTLHIVKPDRPDLLIDIGSKGSSFALGEKNREVSVTVTNVGGSATSGPVNVTTILSAGLTLKATGGSGWTCDAWGACTRSDALAPGASYAPITVRMDVTDEVLSSVSLLAGVTGGGELNVENSADSVAFPLYQLPDIVIAPNGSEGWSQTVSPTVTVAQPELGFEVDLESLEYAWSSSDAVPTEGWVAFENGEDIEQNGSSGVWFLHVRAADIHGHVATVVSSPFLLDIDEPAATPVLETEDGNAYESGVLTNQPVSLASIVASDSTSGVAYVEATLDGGESWFMIEPGYTFGETGSHTLRLRAVDEAGNAAESGEIAIKLVLDAPNVELTPSTEAPTSGPVTVTVGALPAGQAAGNAIAAVKWASGDIADATYFAEAGEDITSTQQFAAETNGTYTVYVRDLAGNVALTTIVIANIDATPPELIGSFAKSDESPYVVGEWSASPVTATLAPFDVGGGALTGLQYSLDGGETWFDGGSYTFAVSGEHGIRWRATNGAGVVGTTDEFAVRVDLDDPTVNAWLETSDGAAYVSGMPTNRAVVVASIDAFDATSNVVSVEKSLDGGESWFPISAGYTFEAGGTYELRLRATDAAGNVGEANYSIVIAYADLELTLTPSPAGPTNGAVTIYADVSGTATDGLTLKWAEGVRDAAEVEQDGVAFEDSFEATANGAYTVYVRDDAGNEAIESIVVDTIVTTPPSIVLEASPTEPTNGSVTVTVSGDVYGEDVGNDFALIKWASGVANASYFETAGDDITATMQFVVSDNGAYTVYARDLAGNEALETLFVDNIHWATPSIAIETDPESPTNGDVLVTITASVYGETNYLEELLWIGEDGEPTALAFEEIEGGDGEQKTYLASTIVEANGDYTVVVRDAAGHVKEQTVGIGNIYRSAPAILLSANTAPTNGTVRIYADIAAEGAQNAVAEVKWSPGQWTADQYDEAEATALPAQPSVSFTVSENGWYTVFAEDAAGNRAAEPIEITNIVSLPPAASPHVGFASVEASGTTLRIDFTQVLDTSMPLEAGDFTITGTNGSIVGVRFGAGQKSVILQVAAGDGSTVTWTPPTQVTVAAGAVRTPAGAVNPAAVGFTVLTPAALEELKQTIDTSGDGVEMKELFTFVREGMADLNNDGVTDRSDVSFLLGLIPSKLLSQP